MAKKTQELDESWQRFPEARIRMRDNGLKLLLDGLGEDGFCLGAIPRIIFDDEGVYIEILFNAGKHGSIVALPVEILIPAKMPVPPKKKAKKNEKLDDPIVVPPPANELLAGVDVPTCGPPPVVDSVPES